MADHRVSLGGVPVYYEVHGTGEPLLLLHVGLGTAALMASVAKSLAEHYEVLLPERRGHGHTPDTPGAYSYKQFAADTIAFLEALDIRRTHIVGLSDGAIIAGLVALQRPDLVLSAVLNGKYLHQDGARLEALALYESWTVETVPPILRELYSAASPDGAEHFPEVLKKVKALIAEGPRISIDEVQQIQCPTLLLVADDDVVTLEHTVSLFRALPNGQLGVIPGTSHAAFLEKPALFATMVLDFLAHPRPQRMTPLTHRAAAAQ